MSVLFTAGRTAHVITALAVGILSWFVTHEWNDLLKDTPTTFGTVGFFVTLYGVAFTIIEVLRTKSAAKLAAQSAAIAAQRVERLYGIRDIVECQSLIESALARIEEEGSLSSSALGRIVKLYAAEFSDSFENDTSPHRVRVAMVTSFAFTHEQSKNARLTNAARLKTALVDMVADLAAANGKRVHMEPSQ